MRSASPIDPRASRDERIRSLDYDYPSQPQREVEACNLCGASVFTVLTHRDRYGYPATACGCRRCGLVFLNPVMTSQAYSRFYVDVYRPLVSAYHGRLIDAHTIQAEQRDYARERGDLLAPYLRARGLRTLLDIGGSTGVVAHAFCERFGLKGTVIDPSPLEIDQARRLGLDTVTGLVEEWDGGGQSFDLVVMSQTVDHLLDIARTLAAIRGIIEPGGVFFIDIVDFRAAYLRNGSVEEAIKIDHPYYLTGFTMEAFLGRAGFDVVRTDFAADHLHIGYVCRPGDAENRALPSPGAVSALWQEVRHVQNAPRP